ncbi:hypothetical protein [Ferrovibrio sp.]|uniref:hypothetical protein n=1 Tax=Ferrovibrio sp. TaxID=1917215 RepID=UPI002618538E|nr:hypothetical protein [Ferrovibrio sp.]
MAKLTISKNNFTAGEIAPDLWGRSDLQGYMNGAARLRNVLLRPTGGVTRRPGLGHVATLDGVTAVRLIAFTFNTEQAYLLVLSAAILRVFRNGNPVFTGSAPWTAAMLPNLTWTQSADTLFLCHPDLPPQRITRRSHTDWHIETFTFAADSASAARHEPTFKFARDDITLIPSATGGTISLTASEDFFLPGHVNLQFRLKKKAVRINSITSPKVAQATVLQTLENTSATADWEEPAFSAIHGWPVCTTIYQDRLAFAGSRDLPNRVWLSKTSDIDNFDLGTGLDDEAIEFALLTDQVDAIRAVVAGRHLQLFTTGAEWMITGEPLTPTKLRADRQTRVGSFADRAIPPRHVDGATLFLSRTGKELREFIYTDIDQSYTAADLALLSSHLFADPVDQDYAQRDRLFLVVMANGRIAALTLYRAQQVAAWTVFMTDGPFRAIAVVDNTIYVAVLRAGTMRIERFVPDTHSDAHLLQTSDAPRQGWSGLEHLEGRTVVIVADGMPQARRVVQNGAITLSRPARVVEIGLPYSHEIRPLPPELGNGAVTSQGGPVRLVRAVFRLHAAKALAVDVGQGLRQLPFGRGGDMLDTALPVRNGDIEVRGLGWVRGTDMPLWRIEQDAPLPCTLLSVITEIKGAD